MGTIWLRQIEKEYRFYNANEFGNCFIAMDIVCSEKPGKHIIEAEVICPQCHTFSLIENATNVIQRKESFEEEEDNPEKILKIE